jgi:hypothetical protein
MKVPTAAPTNSKKHAVDCMKNPGSRFSTALLYPAKYKARPAIQTSPSTAAVASFRYIAQSQSGTKKVGIHSSVFTCARKMRSKLGFPVVAGS